MARDGTQSQVPGRPQGTVVTTQINKLLACKGFFVVRSGTRARGLLPGMATGLDANGRPLPPVRRQTATSRKSRTRFSRRSAANCHIGANAPQGLRLDAGNSYAMLVNVASAEVPGTLRVNPGNPDASYIVQKIEGTAAVGVRMPADGPPYLPQDRIDLVRRWIAAGAPVASAPRLTIDRDAARSRPCRRPRRPDSESSPSSSTPRSTARASAPTPSRCAMRRISPCALAAVRVPQGRQNVVEITTQRTLAAGSYQLAVHGDGPAPLADEAGHVLDGDADGTPGGDHAHSLRCQRRSVPDDPLE